MFVLPKRKTLTEWIEIQKGVKIKVDYPKGDQIHELQNIMADSKGSTSGMYNYARLYLKYTLKDWQGLLSATNEKDEVVAVECKLNGNQLDDDLWYSLTTDHTGTITLFNLVDEELRWVNQDKKK